MVELQNRAGSSERRVQQSVIIVTLTAKMLFRKQRITALAKLLNQYSTVHWHKPCRNIQQHSFAVCVCVCVGSEWTVCRTALLSTRKNSKSHSLTHSLTHSALSVSQSQSVSATTATANVVRSLLSLLSFVVYRRRQLMFAVVTVCWVSLVWCASGQTWQESTTDSFNTIVTQHVRRRTWV